MNMQPILIPTENLYNQAQKSPDNDLMKFEIEGEIVTK